MSGSTRDDASEALDIPWYEPDIDRAELAALTQRSNAPGLLRRFEPHIAQVVPARARAKVVWSSRWMSLGYPGMLSVWAELIPALIRQKREPAFSVERPLPQ